MLIVQAVCMQAAVVSAQHIKPGGYCYVEHAGFRQSLFNPHDLMMKQGGMDPGPKYNLNLYAEARHTRGSVYVQADILARIRGSETWDTDTSCPQFFCDINLGSLVITAGRVIHRWGTGYAFNPTDVIAPAKDVSDPENSMKTAAGNDMVKAEFFGETWSAGVSIMGSVRTEHGLRVEHPRAAFRLYKAAGMADLSVIALIHASEKPLWGVNGVTVIGERLELHGECAWYAGSRQKYHRVLYDEYRLYDTDPFTQGPRPASIHCEWVAGFQYTLSGRALVIAEWLRHEGMSRQQWDRFTGYCSWLHARMSGPEQCRAASNLLWCARAYTQSGAMRHYVMATFQYKYDDRLHARAAIYVNMFDGSYAAMPFVSYRIKNTLSLYVRGFIFKGPRNSEFGEFFQSFSIEGGVRLL